MLGVINTSYLIYMKINNSCEFYINLHLSEHLSYGSFYFTLRKLKK